MTVLSPSLSLPKLHSSFLCCPLKSKLSSSATNRIQQKPTSYPRIRALDLDQNTVGSLFKNHILSFCCFSQIELLHYIVNVFNFRLWL